MKILIVGRGWTGDKVFAELTKRGHSVKQASHYAARDQILETNLPKFDWVVNCAGVTGFPNVDACESDPMATLEGNAKFPIALYRLCNTHGIRFAHWSSGCIYQGAVNSVDADPNFFGSIYSVSKGVSDAYLKDKALVFRIRMPFTGKKENKNYLAKVKNYAILAKLIDAGVNSLSDHDEAVSVSCDLIEEGAPHGAYNLINSGNIDMHELADMMGLNPQWFTAEEFAAVTTAARSTCTIPDCGRMRPLREALADAIARMSNE